MIDPTQLRNITEMEIDLIGKYDFSPKSIIKQLKLTKPNFEQTASWGPYGNMELDFPWEK